MKKTRLLEIIREEISSALGEASYAGKNAIPDLKKDPAFNTLSSTGKLDAQKELSTGGTVELEETESNEDTLMEGPFIEGALDFAYINGEIKKGILGNAIANATQEIKKSFPEIDSDAATKIITSKKSRTAEKTPESVKTALTKIDDAIEAQVETFDNTSLLKSLLNKGEIGKSPEEIERINQYIEPGDDGDIKSYVEKLGFPQTLRAVEKTLQGKSPVDVEPKTTTKKPESAPEKPAKETTKKEEPKAKKSEEPKAEEPKAKESDDDKATKRAKTGGSKLDKMANDQEALLKAKKAAEKERLAVAEKRKNTEDVKEREKLLDDLKRIGKLEGEIQKKLDNLGY
jgi:hypothetical protein